jgi:hypothetical protein
MRSKAAFAAILCCATIPIPALAQTPPPLDLAATQQACTAAGSPEAGCKCELDAIRSLMDDKTLSEDDVTWWTWIIREPEKASAAVQAQTASDPARWNAWEKRIGTATETLAKRCPPAAAAPK